MSRHFFPGGNTPGGFFSYFNNIAWRGERTVYLKGASGCGKSTFMRRAEAEAKALGFTAEIFHCSNDPASLDGLLVPGAGFCIVDATAPHAQDPALPVAHDMLFNMAEFIDPRAVEPCKEELYRLTQEKKRCYACAYGYIAAAWSVLQNNRWIYERFMDQGGVNTSILEALPLLDDAKPSGRAGRNRKLFAGALTPEGFVNTLNTLTGLGMVCVLRGEPGMGTDLFLSRIREAANLRGLDTESLFCPLDPHSPEHLIIPALDLGFFTQSKLWPTEFPAHAREIRFDAFLNEGYKTHREELDYNSAMFGELVGQAMRTLTVQRAVHDRMEKIYIAGMDFGALNAACEKILAKLLHSLESMI